ncbi:MAG: CPBP family intramembrane glutamic endopeptidase [Patescibacteria group bacterium]|jgi:membrane protease YdiL (CAAX protease family)
MDWLKNEAKNSEIPMLILTALLFNLVYSLIAADILIHFSNIKLPKIELEMPICNYKTFIILFTFALREELFFRAPLLLMNYFPDDKKFRYALIMAIMLSAAFGYLHGGSSNILVQGVSGFTLCILFLKTGGINKKGFKALMICTIAHFCFNSFLALILALHGKSTF